MAGRLSCCLVEGAASFIRHDLPSPPAHAAAPPPLPLPRPRPGIGLAARHSTESSVATIQVANTGLLSLTYLQRISEKVSLAADFIWNVNSREATASFGYDYILRQCRLRGRIDTEGKIGAFLEERVNVGVNFIISAELDHAKKDYKFGLGMTVGE